jgi:hypothetical protein
MPIAVAVGHPVLGLDFFLGFDFALEPGFKVFAHESYLWSGWLCHYDTV